MLPIIYTISKSRRNRRLKHSSPRIVFLILSLYVVAFAAENRYQTKSTSYEVKDSPAKVILAEAHFSQPPEKVWELATQFESFSAFVPRFKKCHVTESKDNAKKVSVHIHLPIPLPDLKTDLEVTLTSEKKEYKWKMIKGNLKSNVGSLWIYPEKSGSFVKIGTQVDPGSFIPQTFVAWAVRSYLPTLLNAFGDKLNSTQASPSSTPTPKPTQKK